MSIEGITEALATTSEGHRLLHQVVFHEHHGNKALADKALQEMSYYLIRLEHKERTDWVMETGDFHETQGWYFKRLPDGTVRARVKGYGEHLMPPNSWVSVVAHVSRRGETGETFNEALTFHDGASLPAPEEAAKP